MWYHRCSPRDTWIVENSCKSLWHTVQLSSNSFLWKFWFNYTFHEEPSLLSLGDLRLFKPELFCLLNSTLNSFVKWWFPFYWNTKSCNLISNLFRIGISLYKYLMHFSKQNRPTMCNYLFHEVNIWCIFPNKTHQLIINIKSYIQFLTTFPNTKLIRISLKCTKMS